MSGSSIRRRWSRSIVIVALVTASAGCSRQGAFYVVPEHSNMEKWKGTHRRLGHRDDGQPLGNF